MEGFSAWLAHTPLSELVKSQAAWLIPGVQSIHIASIGVVLASVLMMTLRILGIAGTDRTLSWTRRRFGPWLKAALWTLLGTGIVMIIAEPPRELLAFSFWLKMWLVAFGAAVAVWFQRSLARHEQTWEEDLSQRRSVRAAAVATFLVWLVVIFLGRLIAYDHVWGPLSAATRT